MVSCLIFFVLFQSSIEREILEAENARAQDVSAILEALENSDPHVQRLAVRALGRLERPHYTDAILPLLRSPDTAVRMEAVNALGQMGTDVDLSKALANEKDDAVRGVYYETMGRLPQAHEELLVEGLGDEGPGAQTGAAKGLESFFRRTDRKPRSETLAALRKAAQTSESPTLRQLVLLTLNRAGDHHTPTLTAVLADQDPLVRRLAVIGLGRWKDDPSYLVRYESLRVAGDCARAQAALADTSEHVVLLAIDRLGDGCSPDLLEKIFDDGENWRRQARALVSLAKVSPAAARKRLARFRVHSLWQARTYAAAAAKILKHDETLQYLLRDPHPNVVAAALVEPPDALDALEALESPDYGLLMVALTRLKGWSEGGTAVPALLATLERVSQDKRATSRDPRRQMLERLREFGDESAATQIRYLLSDFDPVIAALVAEIISEKTRRPVTALTERVATRPVPSEQFFRSLAGAHARIRMRDAGTFTLQLVPEEAPVTVATFVRLAEDGYYDGLTLHRIEPNFVLQGGSPGANEYVGTDGYIRDELGLLSHRRGTLGISTRGRDTGDSQIFINLVDNYRLDHNYTVFARVIEGMDTVDRIQEDDIIESIEISRKR